MQTRRYRWFPLILAPFAIIVVAVGVAAARDAHSDDPVVVTQVLTDVRGPSTSDRFEVVVDDGRALFFTSDPGVRVGDKVLVRHKGGGRGLGLVVNGVYRPANTNQGASAVAFFVLAGYAALIALIMAPPMIWGRRTYRQVKADLGAPLSTARGRYLGSWVWRGLSNRFLAMGSRRLGHVAGFPIAIEERPGEVSWFGAPVEFLTDVRHFEGAIATGNRDVIITYHPKTRAVATLQASDGSASLDLQRKIDEMHPESGLQLRVSRRPRKAHLPDF